LEEREIVIIGAGHNGLVAAAYLARAGHDVLVLERRGEPGGASSGEEVIRGFRTSPCAYHVHLLQSRVVEDLRLAEHGLRVAGMDPSYVTPFPDGRALIQWRDAAATQEQIARFSAHDAAAYPDWAEFWRRTGELLDPYTLDPQPPSLDGLRQRVAGTPGAELLEMLSTWTVRQLMSHFFDSEQVQAALMPNSDTKSLDAPGELLGWAMTAPNRGARREHQGIPIGGMSRFAMAVVAAARQACAEIRSAAEVREILLDSAGDGPVASGVRLADGTVIRAGLVVSNADPKRTFGQLIPPGRARAAVAQVAGLDSDSGSLKFHAAVSELPDLTRYLGEDHDPRLLGMLRIAPSLSYIEQSLADAAAGQLTGSPVLIVMIPTVYDPSVAPPGRHLVSVRVKFEPSRLRRGSWAQHRQQAADQVIDLLTEYAPNFRRSVLDHVLYTPDDIEERIGLTDGNIHHINHSAQNMLGGRLFPGGGYRTPIPGLYMCGAGTHPGGDVTGAPGHNAAKFLLSEVTRNDRSVPAAPVTSPGSREGHRP
jgi:phytoene dehydrogenase-like protein